MSAIILLLAMFYGLCMGSFALVSGQQGAWKQMLSSMAKVPALFFLTLAVTLPSLYVFNALVGSRLTAISLLRLLVAAMGVMLALLASFGTIIAFFSFTTTSYSFMVLMNVAVFVVSGILGLMFLFRTLQRLTIAREEPAVPAPATPAVTLPPIIEPEPVAFEASDAAVEAPTVATDPAVNLADTPHHVAAALPPSAAVARVPGALAPVTGRMMTGDVKTVFRLWVVLFGVVGAQMSWILRPFIGGGHEFALFRARGSSFFESVLHHLRNLVS